MAEHKPTDETRKSVTEAAKFGMPQEMICTLVGLGSSKTLRKHYRDELDRGNAEATKAVAETLFHKAVKDRDTACLIFWLKARAGWSEKHRVVIEDERAKTDAELKAEIQRLEEKFSGSG